MGRGIKKISENVIAEKRSLNLVTASAQNALALQEDVELKGVINTEAMPLGMLNVDYSVRGISMKVAQGDKDNDSTWSKLDAKHTLIQQSIITNLIKDQNVTTEKIKDQNVTEAKIRDTDVTTRKIRDLNVTTEKLNDSAVTTIKIADQNVTTAKIKDQNITTIKIKDYNVTTDKIADQNITTRKIKDGAITAAKISDREVHENHMADNSISNRTIINGAVTEYKIADGAIHAHNIATGGVSNANLQNAAVSTDKIEDQAVTNDKIANETINGAEKIAPNSITIDRLEPDLVDELERAVLHDGNGNITGNGEDGSTVLNNIKANGDVYAHRVYNVVYMDIAEAYIPGEKLESGDIVAMHEDGKVYKAKSINDCIVGVVSNEYAHCLGCSREELEEGSKVAVGMIGKIHVKVKGPVRLGQRISIAPFDAGVGCANWMNNNNIGQVLESVDCRHDEIHMVLVQVRPM